MQPENDATARWDRTEIGTERIKVTNPWFFEEDDSAAMGGFFKGRRIISRDTPINSGVYIGAGAREASIVDDLKYPEELNEVYTGLRTRLRQDVNRTVVEHVYDITAQVLGEDHQDVEDKVQEVVKFAMQFGSDTKIDLGSFIRAGAGVCRHRALLAGYLLEKLINEKVIEGRVFVDRNTILGRGGHSWVRFEEVSGRVIIIDPSLGYVGLIQTAPSIWSYERPGK